MSRRGLALPGWAARSVWGRDERHIGYFALLWDDAGPAGPVTRTAQAFLRADTPSGLADRIAERTGRSPGDVRLAMRGGALIANALGPLAAPSR